MFRRHCYWGLASLYTSVSTKSISVHLLRMATWYTFMNNIDSLVTHLNNRRENPRFEPTCGHSSYSITLWSLVTHLYNGETILWQRFHYALFVPMYPLSSTNEFSSGINRRTTTVEDRRQKFWILEILYGKNEVFKARLLWYFLSG